jgi:hypothetical protein
MDSPWASKAWKQTKARIDRPDTGKFFREEAFITWLVTDSTTEILRWARAVSRITQASVFDNANDQRFEKFETVPTFAINKETLAQYSSFDSLRDVTVTTKKVTVHADYVSLFAELQRTEQEVRADALKNDWEYARKHGLIETLKDKNGNLILKDGKPVERPRCRFRIPLLHDGVQRRMRRCAHPTKIASSLVRQRTKEDFLCANKSCPSFPLTTGALPGAS